MNFSLSVEDGKLNLKGDKSKVTKDEIEAIKANRKIIDYIKAHKSELIEYVSIFSESFSLKKSKNISSIYRLSGLQEGMLFHGLSDEEGETYKVQFKCDLLNVNIPAFKKSWDFLIKKHSILRSAFFYDSFNIPVQCVYRQVELPFMELDYREMSEADQAIAVKNYEETDHNRIFDFKQAPLTRITLIRLSQERYRMLWTTHHILFDGWSFAILLEEFLTTYEQLLSDKEVKAFNEDKFEDYIRYLERSNKEKEEAYWRGYLKGINQSTLLPFIAPGTKRTSGIGNYKVETLSFNVAVTEKIQRYTQKNRITINTLTQGVWALLLHQYSGKSDVLFGVVVSGRPDDLPEVESRVGMYINTLPLRTSMEATYNIDTWLQGLQAEQVSSRQHQYTPLQNIQAWTGVKGDLFDTIMVFENYPVNKLVSSGDWSLRVENVQTDDKSNYPLSLLINASEQINILFSYNEGLLNKVYVKQIRDHFENVLLQITDNEENRLGDIKLLTRAEENLLLNDFNATATKYPKAKNIVDLFEEQVRKNPDAIAVIFGTEQLSYKELDDRSNQLGHYLQKQGVKNEMLVPVCMERSLGMIVSTLAILKAGGAYVPIDPLYPQERIAFMLADINAAIVICNDTTRPNLSTVAGLIFIKPDDALISKEAITKLPGHTPPSGLAYVMYTSGSTGRPKGVMIEQGNVISLVKGTDFVKLTDHSRLLVTGSPSFDATTFEYWSMLLNGGSIILCSNEQLLDIEQLKTIIFNHQINIMWFTSSWFNQLMDTDDSLFVGLTTILVGGEKLSEQHIYKFHKKYPKIELINGYGPTENTTFSLTYEIKNINGLASIPIGRPLANRQAYVLDLQRQLVPIGVQGEIYLGGAGLARGYLNLPELTAEKFINNPFSEDAGSRLYKTGDIGRRFPDGSLEYVGRVDDQVKINGYRIEPGEIESVLNNYDQISQAVVLAKEDDNGQKRLVGYIVPADKFDKKAIQDYLITKLPEYMIPDVWVEIKSMPLTANGKIDKKALPSPEVSEMQSKVYIGPQNKVEEKLVKIWQDLLKIARVGINDDFFEIGGHSLLAMRLVSVIRKQMKAEIKINDIFENPTIADQAQLLGHRHTKPAFSSITVQKRPEFIPLSFNQERLWFIDQLEGSVQYHVSAVLHLNGKLNELALSYAIQTIINRHEVLRTVYLQNQGDVFQFIKPENEFYLSVIDGAHFKDDASGFTEYLRNLTRQPFNLSKDDMIRGTLINIDGQEYVLVVTIHHIASDGWSMSVIIKELVELYEAYCIGAEPNLPVLPVQYADYAIWQRSYMQNDALRAGLTYWKTKLADIYPLTLPTDYVRPSLSTNQGASEIFYLEKELTDKLQALGQTEGATLFMTLLATFNVLLYRYSGQDDICIGSPIANRTLYEVEQLIGFFLNTLALRNEVNGHETFRQLLKKVKTTTLEAYEHQDVPFEKVVEVVTKERDLSKTPLFQVMFVLQNTPDIPQLHFNGIQLSAEPLENNTAKFDISFTLTPDSFGLRGLAQYSTDLYSGETIKRMLGHFKQLLYAVINKPDERIDTLSLLDKAEEEIILHKFNATQSKKSKQKNLIDLFEEQVAKYPKAIALVFGQHQLTYQELNERANRLANYLTSCGVKAGSLVPICIERSVQMIVGALGILKAGGAYVPIDPAYPQDRISYMLEDTNAAILLTEEKYSAIISTVISIGNIIKLDTQWSEIQFHSANNPGISISSVQLAYLLYTSGSTGKPKGVEIEHHSLTNHLNWFVKQYQINNHDSTLLTSSFSFDGCMTSIWPVLITGGALHLASYNHFEPEWILDYIFAHNITYYKTLPSVFDALLNTDKFKQSNVCKSIRLIILGGEPITVLDLIAYLSVYPDILFANHYGPTECTIGSSFCLINKDNIEEYYERPVIGKPINNTNIYILSGNDQLNPIGLPGEICISGDGVARGYLNEPELTKEKFIANPFNQGRNPKLYKTGDIGRWLPDGNIVYMGRGDNQVKIRGYRVELEEIENVLQQSELIERAVVLAKEHDLGNKQLVAYVVPSSSFNQDAIIFYLKNKLPAYMVPSLWVALESFSLSPNGKIDRKALPDPEKITINDYVAPRNETEKDIAIIWQELLGIEKIGVNDNFFELGGHSLLAMRVISAMRNKLEIEPAVRDIFVYPTIAGLATFLATSNQALLFPAITKQARPKYIPLSFSQEGLWFIDQLEGSIQYHMPTVLKLQGQLKTIALERSLQYILNRHEVLRTVIRAQDGQPYQKVKDGSIWQLTMIDGSGYKEDAEGLQSFVQKLIKEPFDLSTDFMLRANLIKLAEQEHMIVMVIHHIASDGWSTSVFVKEIAELYKSYAAGLEPNLPQMPIQYGDYAIWQRNNIQGDLLNKKINYWKEKLSGTEVLQLPADNIKLPTQNNKGAIKSFSIDKKLSVQLNELSKQHEASLFMTLLTAFKILLYRYTHKEDICVGTGIAGRQQHELEGLIGLFINTLALRDHVLGEESFLQLLQQVKTTTLEAYENQEVPFERVVDTVVSQRSTDKNPFFQIMFALNNTPDVQKLELSGLQILGGKYEHTTSKFDLTFLLSETQSGVQASVEYNTGVFNKATITQMISHYTELLNAITQSPELSIWSLPMMTAFEKKQLLIEYNNTSTELLGNETVISLFEQQVLKTPAAPALVYKEENLTYTELNERANKLAHYLKSKGIKEETLVPICFYPSVQMIVSILAVLKAGAAYVPIDPDYPEDRISYMLKDTAASVILRGADVRANLQVRKGAAIIIADEGQDDIRKQPDNNVSAKIKPHHLAYIIYTSGSTGKPKGVMIEHGNLLNYLLNSQTDYITDDCKSSGSFIHLSYTFDASVTGIFTPLLSGKLVVIGSKRAVEVFEDNNLQKYAPYDFIKVTPSHLGLLENAFNKAENYLTKRLVVGGEALQLGQLAYLNGQGIEVEIINEYGPTEATVGCCTYRLDSLTSFDDLSNNVSIGKPIANAQIYILNEFNEIVPIGVAGELCIGGAGLARGYLNLPELTAERFINHPFSDEPGKRIYKTGDLARWLSDGNIEYLGRIDDQVKVRGYRIELGEIETTISSIAAVKNVKVLAVNQKLKAYIQVNQQYIPLLSDFERLLNQKQIKFSDLHVLPNGLPVLSANLNEVRFLYQEIFEDHCYLKHGITLNEDSCVIDIGANVGFFTVFLNVLSKNIKVYSFEPIPEVYHYLAANRELYNIKGKSFQLAITDIDSEMDFTYYPQVSIVSGITDVEQVKAVVRSYIKKSDHNELITEEIDSLLAAKLESKKIKVKTKTVSQIIEEENIEKIDLLKIDVENSEHLVINGLLDKDWAKIGSVIIEIHDTDNRLSNIQNLLVQKGFHTYVEKEKMLSEDDILYNLFAIRDTSKKGMTDLGDKEQLRATEWSHPTELVEYIKADIEKKLPGYMVPSQFSLLDQFPLTNNGKLDKNALLNLEDVEIVNDQYEAPVTEIEKGLEKIWQELLGVETIGTQDNFFELGGDSLTAVRLVSLIRKNLAIELPISDVFDYSTIASLALRLQSKSSTELLSVINVQTRPDHIPLSFGQERFWFIDQLNGSTEYHIPAVLRLKGKLNPAALENALRSIVNRHEILRTVIKEYKGQGYQIVQEENGWRLDIMDGSVYNNDPGKLKQDISELLASPFDLSKDYMLRATLIKVDNQDSILVATMHHIASDGWSLSIFIKELVEIYSAYQEGRPALLAPLPIQYADYAIWQRTQLQGELLNKKISYWKEKLQGTEPIQLPTDYARPGIRSNIGAVRSFGIDKVLSEEIQALSQQQGVTLFMTLLAAFKVLLHRYSGQQKICVGTSIAGRQQEEVEGIIGLFLNTLALQSTITSDAAFTDLLQEIKTTTLEAYEHQEVPFEKVVDAVVKRRDTDSTPLFQIVFVLQNIPDIPKLHFEGVSLSSEAPENNSTKFDIIFNLVENELGLRGAIQYSTELFSAGTIDNMANHFKGLLASIINAPSQKVSALSMSNSAKRDQLPEEFNTEETGGAKDNTMVGLFEQQVIKNPDSLALIFEEEELTYRELNERSNQLAHYLRAKGVKEDTIVAIFIERRVEMIVGILGVLKAGGAYVPIDLEYPQDRINYVLEDTQAKQILCSKQSGLKLPYKNGVELIELDSSRSMLDGQPKSNLKVAVEPGQLAYVIYTSGSTGVPKGVMIQHKGNVNMSVDQIDQFEVTQQDKILQFASVSFDASVSELFMAFYAGAALVLMSKEMIQDAANFASNLVRTGVSVVTLPPAYLRNLQLDDLKFLRVLITAGEAADVHQAAYLSSFLNYYNAYGPTECSVCVSIYKVDPADKVKSRIPIGKPVANTRMYILDEAKELVPAGIPGELYVAGAGLAKGYLNLPELTAEIFTNNPFNEDEKLYRTGDIVRELPDGNIEFLGRRDDQIKLRGYRVELGEIENTLRQHNDIDSCVVIANEDKEYKQLISYYKLKNKTRLWPSVAEFYVYDDLLYKTMAGDEARNAKYRNAIRKVVKDKVILEIGPGFEAILSRICIEEGAKKVYAVELLESSYLKAKATVEALGLEDKIIVIHDDIMKVELPEKADYCVSEIVGAIGGAEGSATLINSSRRLLKDPSHMIPSRSLTKIAAITLPESEFDNSFDELGAYYTSKIFEQTGRKFDLRVYLNSFPIENIISNEDVFEDLDYTRECKLEDEQDIFLVFQQASVVHGFIVWLNLFCDDEEFIDTVNGKYTWLPVYFPAFDRGEEVLTADFIKAKVTRKISSNNLNPDFIVAGTLVRKGQANKQFVYESMNCADTYQGNTFYEKIFENDDIRVAKKVEREDLKEFLKSKLPEYMIPSLFIEVDEFTLNINGKIDKKALRSPDTLELQADKYEQPRNELESTLVNIWQEVLELDQIGINDDFFELGGHSLLAIRLISVIRKALDMEVAIAIIFDNPTIASLAAELKNQAATDTVLFPTLIKQARPARLPLSFAQERLWFIDSLEGSRQYHMPVVLRLRGTLDISSLNKAIGEVVNRHEVLRTVIRQEEGQGYQWIQAADNWRLTVTDGNRYQLDAAGLALHIEELISAPFDLSSDMMLRATLIGLQPEEYILVVTMHHIAADGWSASVLVREVVAL
ncbi:amino acid adenylation domain-containing protein, partial [Mucilaginibacter sp. UYCu711]|uniref:amino acid adenylation domain-containing protein n=1 Tax=Mucilaginibacter sp. UYCu711 TaxID=3156339 RepID=UPI003D1B4BD7